MTTEPAPIKKPLTESKEGRLILLLPAILAFFVSLNVLQNGFVWDDITIHRLVDRVGVQALPSGQHYYRPIVFLSYEFDRWIWGSNSVGYHLTGLLLHSLITLFVTVIALMLFRDQAKRLTMILLSGVIFAVHPVHTEVVAWIAGRNDLLATFFLLIGVILHLHLRLNPHKIWIYPFFFASLGLALLSKESALPYLLIFILYDFLFFKPRGPLWQKILSPSTGILTILGIAYFWFRSRTLISTIPSLKPSDASLLDQVPNLFLAIGYYLKELFYPLPLNAFIMLPTDYTIQQTLYMGLGFTALILILAMTIRGRTPYLTLSLWGIILGMAAALALPLTQFTHVFLAERYLYLPSVAFSLALGPILIHGLDLSTMKWQRWTGRIIIGILLVGTALISFAHNRVWQSELTLWEDTAKKSPQAALALNRLGRAYIASSQKDKAKKTFEMALKGQGRPEVLANAAINLGAIKLEEGQIDSARETYELALQYHESRSEPHFGLGLIYWTRYQSGAQQGDPSDLATARYHLMASVLYSPNYTQGYHLLGQVNVAANRFAAARKNFEKVIQLRPNSPLAQDSRRRLSELAK